MDLLVVGSMGYDHIQTPTTHGYDVLGGSAVHASISAAFHLPLKPGILPRVGIIGPIGNDFRGEDLELLNEKGINTEGVAKLSGKTFRWAGKYEGTMNDAQTISTEINVLGDFDPVIPNFWKDVDILFCANMNPLSQVKILEECNPNISVLDTFMLWINTEFEVLSEALRKVDVAILNEEEVCAISGEDIVTIAAEKIISGEALYGGSSAGKGPRSLIIKRGSGGVLAYLPCGTISLPSYPTKKVIDPTGCGDSFAGALLANIVGSTGAMGDIEIMRNALVHATVTSSFVIGGLGSTNLTDLQKGKYHARVDKYRRIVGLT
ncbi:MAG: PfkB family carbohydrate kinase [Candidatus Thalassarchaeaceae archaeon]|jgi:sugar/nucleoside kinase (ribokinase family)